MTEPEFKEHVIPAIEGRWERYQMPAGLLMSLWKRLSRFSYQAVLWELNRVAGEDLDAPKPNWQLITDRLNESGGREAFTGWSMADECAAAYIQAQDLAMGLEGRTIEQIAYQSMGRQQSPTPDQRKRAKDGILACYEETLRLDSQFVPTIHGIRVKQQMHIDAAARIRSLANIDVQTGRKKKEQPLCEQKAPGKLSFEAYLEDAVRGKCECD